METPKHKIIKRDRCGRFLKGFNHSPYKNKRKILKCIVCGNKTKPLAPSRIKNGRGKFCSRHCTSKYIANNNPKIYKWKKGQIVSPSTQFKKGQTCGKKNYNWKGGITPINKQIRYSLRYKKWRKRVFKRDKYTCQKCGKNKTYIHAHHIKPFSLYPSLRFKLNNGLTLCKKCHNLKNIHKLKKENNGK